MVQMRTLMKRYSNRIKRGIVGLRVIQHLMDLNRLFMNLRQELEYRQLNRKKSLLIR